MLILAENACAKLRLRVTNDNESCPVPLCIIADQRMRKIGKFIVGLSVHYSVYESPDHSHSGGLDQSHGNMLPVVVVGLGRGTPLLVRVLSEANWAFKAMSSLACLAKRMFVLQFGFLQQHTIISIRRRPYTERKPKSAQDCHLPGFETNWEGWPLVSCHHTHSLHASICQSTHHWAAFSA